MDFGQTNNQPEALPPQLYWGGNTFGQFLIWLKPIKCNSPEIQYCHRNLGSFYTGDSGLTNALWEMMMTQKSMMAQKWACKQYSWLNGITYSRYFIDTGSVNSCELIIMSPRGLKHHRGARRCMWLHVNNKSKVQFIIVMYWYCIIFCHCDSCSIFEVVG